MSLSLYTAYSSLLVAGLFKKNIVNPLFFMQAAQLDNSSSSTYEYEYNANGREGGECTRTVCTRTYDGPAKPAKPANSMAIYYG